MSTRRSLARCRRSRTVAVNTRKRASPAADIPIYASDATPPTDHRMQFHTVCTTAWPCTCTRSSALAFPRGCSVVGTRSARRRHHRTERSPHRTRHGDSAFDSSRRATESAAPRKRGTCVTHAPSHSAHASGAHRGVRAVAPHCRGNGASPTESHRGFLHQISWR